jgi:hypothetical protein
VGAFDALAMIPQRTLSLPSCWSYFGDTDDVSSLKGDMFLFKGVIEEN